MESFLSVSVVGEEVNTEQVLHAVDRLQKEVKGLVG